MRWQIKNPDLGKGLGQLFLENSVDELVANNTLPLEEIVPNKEQPRKTFDETALGGIGGEYSPARRVAAPFGAAPARRRVPAW